MNSTLSRSLILAVCIGFNAHSAGAQAVSEEWLKSEYVILLAGYISWPDEENIDTFRIGVYRSESIYSQFSLKSEVQLMKGKPYHAIYFRRFRDIQPVDLLYIDKSKNKSLRKILQQFGRQPVLIVSDSAIADEYTMLNILGMNINEGKPFVLNKTNMDNAGLRVSPKILYFGGDEDDLRDIYRELRNEEHKLRAELDTLNIELEKKQQELASSEKKLEEQSTEVARLVEEIEAQTKALTTLSDSIDLKQLDLIEKIRLLADQEKRIKRREKEINGLNSEIRAKEREVLEGSELIEKQLEDIESQRGIMQEQQRILDNQKIQIERQKIVLFFFLILSVLILGMGFLIYRAYRIKKNANRILSEKNRVIELQNENITASIYYALTIQQAMLPDIEEIEKHFKSFIIYLPKDIVSGDFYWFTQRGRKRSGEQSYFIAVADCTGHGVPGGFLSMIGARMLDAIVNEQKVDQTDEILELMDQRIRKALNQNKTDNEDGMDICLCRITYHESEDQNVYLSFSGARRTLFLTRQGREVEMIRGDRRTIGGRRFVPSPFSKIELSLKRGDRIYLTTDGLMDQHSPDRDKFGTKRFMAFLKENASLGMHKQKTILEEQMIGFMQQQKQRDDITIMGIIL
jgi:serine phosphatase RsbU (regulator of sigma subunit)